MPTAFYRHFDSIEAARAGAGRRVVRVAARDAARRPPRRPVATPTSSTARSPILVEHVHQQRSHFLFIARERAAGPPAVREAIRHEIELCERELATDLARLPGTDALVRRGPAVALEPDRDGDGRDRRGDPAACRRTPTPRSGSSETARTQLRMVLVGALNWRSRSPDRALRQGVRVGPSPRGSVASRRQVEHVQDRRRPRSPGRSSATRRTSLPSCSCTFSCIGVAVRPGKTVVTRTPCSCSSARSASARARSPNFEAAYADHCGAGGQPGAGVHEDDGAAGRPQRRQAARG